MMLKKLRLEDGLVSAFCQILSKAVSWYPQAYSHLSVDRVLKVFDPNDRNTAAKLPSLRRHAQSDEVDQQLKVMIEDEMFPLCEYFAQCPMHSNTGGNVNFVTTREWQFLLHPRVKAILKLTDIIPRLKQYVTWSNRTLQLVKDLDALAPPYQRSIFRKHVRYYMATEANDALCLHLALHFPHARLATINRTFLLRSALRECDIEDIHCFISAGAKVNHKQLYYDFTYIVSKWYDLEGWCQAITALQEQDPDLGWCEDPRQKWLPWSACNDGHVDRHFPDERHRDPKRNFDTLMFSVLMFLYDAEGAAGSQVTGMSGHRILK
ncbi:hypothetical protein HDV00_011557 [Rhizophlyctis rosea]|nr:hypothetical protein HDV00_011557 [Rhizophlyctis rosea]